MNIDFYDAVFNPQGAYKSGRKSGARRVASTASAFPPHLEIGYNTRKTGVVRETIFFSIFLITISGGFPLL